MNETAFPHHSGGVVQVQHFARFGAVPESLLEDSRLDLDSRTVAAWLAVKPAGWQISIKNLRQRLARIDKKILGKDRWQRIAQELESAGYLFRKKINGKGGQWVWHIVFNPVPASGTVAGFASYGSAAPGTAVDGLAVGGIDGHKELPREELQVKKTTTTNRAQAPNFSEEAERNLGHHDESTAAQELHYPKVTPVELTELRNLILLCHVKSRQDVLDEVEGIRKTSGIKVGAVPLTRDLIKKVANGKFSPSAGLSIRQERQTRSRNEQILSATASSSFQLLVSEEDLAKLPPNLAKRAREAAARVLRLNGQGQKQKLSNPGPVTMLERDSKSGSSQKPTLKPDDKGEVNHGGN